MLSQHAFYTSIACTRLSVTVNLFTSACLIFFLVPWPQRFTVATVIVISHSASCISLLRHASSFDINIHTPVAYPGGFSGCPDPPGHDFFLIRGFTSLHAPTFTSHLNLRLLETPLDTNSGYATAPSLVSWQFVVAYIHNIIVTISPSIDCSNDAVSSIDFTNHSLHSIAPNRPTEVHSNTIKQFRIFRQSLTSFNCTQ